MAGRMHDKVLVADCSALRTRARTRFTLCCPRIAAFAFLYSFLQRDSFSGSLKFCSFTRRNLAWKSVSNPRYGGSDQWLLMGTMYYGRYFAACGCIFIFCQYMQGFVLYIPSKTDIREPKNSYNDWFRKICVLVLWILIPEGLNLSLIRKIEVD